jgi:non-ribosomal peptide synthetase component F
VLLAAMAAYLSERTGQQDLAITSHLLYRHLPGLDRTPGLYPNPLIMRISTADAPTFHELVARTHETVTSAFDHGDADVLGGAPELFGRLFFNYLDPVDDAGEPTQLPDVTRTPCELPGTYHYGAGYDLILSLRRREDRVDLSLMYNTELFREDGAARLLRGYIESVERHASKGRYR